MRFKPKLIKSLQKIFREDYGVVYSDTEAQEVANNLVNYFELLIKIDSRSNNKKI